MTDMITKKKIIAAAEKAGWNCNIKRNDDGKSWLVNFNTDTSHGQDVQYDYAVKILDEIKDEVYETWQGYDSDEEALLWYGAKKGEPSSLRDLLNDMDEVDEALERLYTALNGGILPEEQPKSLSQKAGELFTECLSELLSNFDKAKQSPFGYDAKGFANPDKCSKYEWIINLYGKWVLLDDGGYQYSVTCMPLEEFCEMVDNILKRQK